MDSLVITDGSLTRRPNRLLHCLLVEVHWQINMSKYQVTMNSTMKYPLLILLMAEFK